MKIFEEVTNIELVARRQLVGSCRQFAGFPTAAEAPWSHRMGCEEVVPCAAGHATRRNPEVGSGGVFTGEGAHSLSSGATESSIV